MNKKKIKTFKSAPIFLIALLLVTLLFWGTCVIAETIETISPKQAAALVLREKDNADFVILDIRTPPEFKNGHLHGAVLVDYYSRAFIPRLKQLDKSKIYLIYCRSGNRSGKALALFKHLGFNHAYNMAEGINGWQKAGSPVIR
jgi:rhodanese-related sulfurtransferase